VEDGTNGADAVKASQEIVEKERAGQGVTTIILQQQQLSLLFLSKLG
jgi:hypothetical protein